MLKEYATTFKPFKGRTIAEAQRVKVYRNLHNGKWSIADAKTGHVLGHATHLTLADAEFKVNEAGRQRVLREKKKNVHAFVVGYFIDSAPAQETRVSAMNPAYYNPYKVATFMTPGQTPLLNARLVLFSEGGKVRYM